MRPLLTSVFVLFSGASCSFDPHPRSGSLACESGSNACPAGYTCLSGACWAQQDFPSSKNSSSPCVGNSDCASGYCCSGTCSPSKCLNSAGSGGVQSSGAGGTSASAAGGNKTIATSTGGAPPTGGAPATGGSTYAKLADGTTCSSSSNCSGGYCCSSRCSSSPCCTVSSTCQTKGCSEGNVWCYDNCGTTDHQSQACSIGCQNGACTDPAYYCGATGSLPGLTASNLCVCQTPCSTTADCTAKATSGQNVECCDSDSMAPTGVWYSQKVCMWSGCGSLWGLTCSNWTGSGGAGGTGGSSGTGATGGRGGTSGTGGSRATGGSLATGGSSSTTTGVAWHDVCFPKCPSQVESARCNGDGTLTLCSGFSDGLRQLVIDCTRLCASKGQSYTGTCGKTDPHGSGVTVSQDVCWCDATKSASLVCPAATKSYAVWLDTHCPSTAPNDVNVCPLVLPTACISANESSSSPCN